MLLIFPGTTRHSLQPLTLCLCLARHEIWAFLRSQSGSLQSLNCPTVELPFLRVRSVRNAQSSPLQRDYQETQQSPSSPHPAEPFIVPLALCPPCFPEVHASKQLCFLDGHSPFVFLSAATGFLVSAVSNSS